MKTLKNEIVAVNVVVVDDTVVIIIDRPTYHIL